jgi:hypothetical protein
VYILSQTTNTTDHSHLEQLLGQIPSSTAFRWSSSGYNQTDSSSWSNSDWYWAGTGHCPATLELLPTVLSNSFWLFNSSILPCGLRSLAYSVLAWTAKRLPIVTLSEATVDSLLRKRESARSLVSAVAVSYPRYLLLSGYCETDTFFLILFSKFTICT